jgi:hypothetical protein
MEKKFLVIEGYDSQSQIYECKIPVGCITEKQVRQLLKTLAAKAGLENDEIVCSQGLEAT